LKKAKSGKQKAHASPLSFGEGAGGEKG